MNGVWSLWTAPAIRGPGSRWADPRFELLSWVLSVEVARHHFSKTVLHADARGAQLLVDELGIHFDTVILNDELERLPPDFWALGKLATYLHLDEPFIHIDSDVYLWQSPSSTWSGADLFAQNPEPLTPERWSWYPLDLFEDSLGTVRGTWLPECWQWFRKEFSGAPYAICCGVFGGERLDVIREYAELCFAILQHPVNAGVVTGMKDKARYMVMLEQFLLAAILEYRRAVGDAVEIRYLFNSPEEAHNLATVTGYTHLIANAKRNPYVLSRLKTRVANDYPNHYERYLQVTSKADRA